MGGSFAIPLEESDAEGEHYECQEFSCSPFSLLDLRDRFSGPVTSTFMKENKK